jgi:hypothetical protein
MAPFPLLILLPFIICIFALSPGIHLPLHRRGGRATHHTPTNLTYLTQVLHDVEARYMRSTRAVEGNSLVRHWRPSGGFDENNEQLVSDLGKDGGW